MADRAGPGRAFVTGSAGFIGYHLCRHLLDEGWQVAGFDAMTDYYDVALKERRHAMLLQSPSFSCRIGRLEDMDALARAYDEAAPDLVVHLAAQAGVRYSLENPRAYVEANLIGTFNLMECVRESAPGHFLAASTSSVYGANTQMPFTEDQPVAHPLTLYAATKTANEAMAHSYAHLWTIPTTMFRFFTVYGPWGRPDHALFKFVRAGLAGEPIDLYNRGEMRRDFTYVGDLVRAVALLAGHPPPPPGERGDPLEGDTLSPVAPFRVVNVGNGEPVELLDFVAQIEEAIGRPLARNDLPMQPGDVPATWADTSLLERLTGYAPRTSTREGIRDFVGWFRDYYGV